MKQKKLLIFIPSIEGGGVEKNLYIIANYLSQNISKVSLISCSVRQKKKFNNEINFISPFFSFWDKTTRRTKYLVCLVILIKEIIKDKNMLVFSFQANLYAALICHFFGIKIISRSNTSPSGWSKNFLKFFLYKLFLKLPNHIIVNSKNFKKEFQSLFKVKTQCIYNPLNLSEILFKSKQKIKNNFFKKNTLNILAAGRLVEQKDFMTFLKSIALLKSKINFKALIIGKGIEKKKLDQFILKNNLKQNVKIIKFQSNLYKYINKCNLFVLTSKYEGLPNVLLEAQALKKFIISTDCPTGPREILLGGKAGDLIKVGDYRSLSRKILNFQVNKNKKKIKNKISLGSKYLHRFDETTNLKKYLLAVKKFIK